ncbi:MAG: hypothetical protein FWH17_02255 [Oscillospiraceae bacterium]|nr:hypothetical protein [Oscillospiraceae bacterium]
MRLSTQKHKKHTVPIRDIAIFASLGAIMYVSFAIMQGIPNIHPIGLFVAAITLTYRAKALIPIYLYVLIYGVFSGFSIWWIPYLYIWLPLWFAFMLAGKLKGQKKIQVFLYMAICGLHGLSFGTLYAPAQALFFGFTFEMMIAWIAAGFWFDVIHAIGNIAAATLIIPLAGLLTRLRYQTVS